MSFILLYAIRNEITYELQYAFELNIPGNEKIEVRLNTSEISSAKQFANTLKRYGIFLDRKLSEDKKAFNQLQKCLKSVRIATNVNQTGWHRDDFVMSRTVIGKNKKRLLAPHFGRRRQKGDPDVKGLLANWKRDILPARSSSAALASIAAAFAAPTLKFVVNVPSFSIWLSGPVKSKIQTALIAGASAVGFGENRELPNLPATESAHIELAAKFRDYMLPLNAMQLAHSSAMGKYIAMERLGHIGSKQDWKSEQKRLIVKARAKRIDHPRSIIFAVGSQSLAELAEDAGKSRADGYKAHFYDLQVMDGRADDIFDFLKSSNDRQRIVRAYCERIEKAARENHGCALKAFIVAIQGNPITATKTLHKFRKEFLSKYQSSDGDPNLLSCIQSFAHLYSALRYAIKLGIVPFTPKRVQAAMLRCYRLARRSIRQDEILTAQAKKHFLSEVKKMKLVTVRSSNDLPPKTADGFLDERRRVIVLRGEVLKQMFRHSRQPALLLAWLYKAKSLKSGRRPPAVLQTSILWAESQIHWGNGERVRSVIIGN